MPSSPVRLCLDCTKRSIDNTQYCADHQTDNNRSLYKRTLDRARNDDPIRHLYYSKRWQATRRVVFRRDILCAMCGHKAATECDHVNAARVIVEQFGVDAFYDAARCQGLCRSCHASKTATEDSTFAKRKSKA